MTDQRAAILAPALIFFLLGVAFGLTVGGGNCPQPCELPGLAAGVTVFLSIGVSLVVCLIAGVATVMVRSGHDAAMGIALGSWALPIGVIGGMVMAGFVHAVIGS